jgi:hypothetical protein
MGFLAINQTSAGVQDADAVPGLDGLPTYRNFRFEDIRVQDAPVLVDARHLDARQPLDGLVLQNISGTCQKGISLANARNVKLRGIQVSGFTGPLLSTVNVSGKGLENASKTDALPEAGLVAAPATPYHLH